VALAIAQLVILHRTRAGLSQEVLAERMGTSVPAISRLESGWHTPTTKTLAKLASALGMDLKIDLQPRSGHPKPARRKRLLVG